MEIEIIKDGEKILDTGGGILKLIKSSTDNDFLVLNPDTVWSSNNKETVKEMIEFYYDKKIKNLLMVVNKSKSFDKRFKGDFELKENKLVRQKENNFIYTGCQIINKNLFHEIKETSFSISNIWNKQLDSKNLHGYESKEEFFHLTDLEIYNKLLKNN